MTRPTRSGQARVLLFAALLLGAQAVDASAQARPFDIGAAAQGRQWPTEGPPRPLAARPITFPPYEIKTLTNGLKVVLVSHHEQPVVSVRMIVRAGAAMDPKDKAGLAMLTAQLLDQGAGDRTAEQMADTIDFAGGILSTGAGTDLTYISAVVMNDSLELGLQLLADVARRPTFAPEEVERQRQQALSALKVAAEDPDSLASRVIDRLIYGFHPYGMPGSGTPDSLASIQRQDFVDFHQKYYVPNNALLAVVGDVTAAEALAGVQKAFGDWASREVPAFTPIEPPPPTKRVVIIDKPDAVQTEIRVGQLGIPRKHADYVALDQAVKILGGEGANRLQQVLRSQRGLTYGASADLNTYKVTGGIVAETDTRSSATAETLRVMVDEVLRLQRERVYEGELLGAQNYMVGHFPLTVETPDAIATQVLNQLFYELPLEELQDYRERTLRVTPDDIQRVARSYFKPDRLSVVLVGNASAFINDLKGVGFGDFERIPIEDVDLLSADLKRSGRNAARPGGMAQGGLKASPPLVERVAYQQSQAATPPAATALDPLLHEVIAARGGLDALTNVKRIIADADTILTTPDGKVSAKTKTYIEYPSRMRVDAQLPDARIVQVFADGKAWVQDPGGIHDAPPDMLAEFAASAKRDLRMLLVGAANGQFEVRPLGEEEHDGRPLKVLGVSGEGVPQVRLHIDPQTASVVKITYDSRTPGPGNSEPRPTEEIFSDYRVVEGVSVPFSATVRRGGMVLLERQLTNVQINAPIEATLFAKPLR
jgi:zinc protease